MAGFPVIIGASNIIICALLGFLWGAAYGELLAGLSAGLMFFISIFLHECGHAFMCKLRGVSVFEMNLNGAGGYVRHAVGVDHVSGLLITLAGPFMNLLLMILGNMLTGRYYVEAMDVMRVLAQINGLLLVFNLLPIVPLDGGHILHRILWMFYSRWENGRAVVVRNWEFTPDQIVGKIGVIAGYLWIPFIIVIFLFQGILFLFFPPMALSKALASGQTKLPV